MSVTILPVEASDATEISTVGLLAFEGDEVERITAPISKSSEQFREHRDWRAERMVARQSRPNRYYFKAVDDETGAIVGCSGFHGPQTAEAKQGNEPRYNGLPAFLNKAAFDEIEQTLTSASKRHVADQSKIWYIQAMFVHPDFQRRGIAKRLLLRGLELVDQDGLDCYIEASRAAVGVYQRVGFEVLEELPMLDGRAIITPMIRKARSKSEFP